MIRLGLVDFDTSHVVAFTTRLNHVKVAADQWVEGARVVAGCPGTSLIEPGRIPGYVAELKALGIEIVEQPADLLGKVDGILIESQGGAAHLAHARFFLEKGLPCYIDKPFTCSVKDARAIVDLAKRKKLPVFSASSLRYGLEVVDTVARRAELGAVLGCDTYTPASLHPGNPGFFHYGIHGVEMLYTLMGPGCREVSCVASEGSDLLIGRWQDGRLGTVRGIRKGASGFGFTAQCEKRVVATSVNASFIYRELLKAMVAMFQTGQPPIDPMITVEIVAFIEAGIKSASNHGNATRLEV